MFKLVTFVCLLAVSVQCKSVPSPAVPYSPQPQYPQAYRQVYAVQPKYNAQYAYVAAPVPYAPVNYRQVVPANPAYNPYYYGYAPYPAYQPYPYQYAPGNDGAQAPEAAAQPGWGEYLSSNFWNYVPNFPAFGASENPQPAEAESGATSSAESSSSEAAENPGKGDKPVVEVPKTEQKPTSDEQPSASPAPSKQFGPSPFVYFGQPQFYGQQPYQPYQQVVYDPSKLNAANNGAVSSFLFYRNQPQSVFPQPQQYNDQKYYQIPAPQFGSAATAYQRYLQATKQPQQGQYQQGQYLQEQYQPQQDQPFQQQQQQSFQEPQQLFQQQQQSFQEPQQPFQQQQQAFPQNQQQQQQQQQFEPQQDEPSVVVDSNAAGTQSDVEGQREAQPKLATGPTVAVAQPQGLAFAGVGGRAGAGPVGTAIVGKNATAISGPKATAISLDLTPTVNLEPVHKLTAAYVAKYSPELGVYRVAEIKSFGH